MTRSKIRRYRRRLRSPMRWELPNRRAFLLTLPVSLPLWSVAMLGLSALVRIERFAQTFLFIWNAPGQRQHLVLPR